MKLSEMRLLLAERNIRLTKSLGQNFLHDANQLRRIAAAADLQSGDRVLEIGPGLGPLTALLLQQAVRVVAIETDARLVVILRERFGETANLELIHADALSYLRTAERDWAAWKLVSNLPYSIASPLLVDFAQMPAGPGRITATLQLEVAQRLMAVTGNDAFGILSLLVQVRYTPVDLFRIPASCFFPAPDVDSACITLTRRPVPLLDQFEVATFTQLVKLAFSQRRKMMIKVLKSKWALDDLQRAFAGLGISPQARAEHLALDQYVALTKTLGSDAG